MSPDPADIPAAAVGAHMPEPTWTEREVVTLLKRSIDDGNSDRRELIRVLRENEKAAVLRHAEVVTALQALDSSVDAATTLSDANAKKPGALGTILVWVDNNPTLKQAVMSTLLQMLGIATLGMTAYATLHFTGLAPTPSPVVTMSAPSLESIP